MPNNILLSNLIHLRKKKRFTQKQMASFIEVSLQIYQAWEYYRSIPQTIHIKRLSELFGCTIDYLCRYDFKGNENKNNKYSITWEFK